MKFYFYVLPRPYISSIIEQLTKNFKLLSEKKKKCTDLLSTVKFMGILRLCHCLYQYYYELEILTKCLSIRNSGITFQSWKSSSNKLFTQNHCILVTLFLKSTFLYLPFSSRCKEFKVWFLSFSLLNKVFLYSKQRISCVIMEFCNS